MGHLNLFVDCLMNFVVKQFIGFSSILLGGFICNIHTYRYTITDIYGLHQAKKCLPACVKCAESDHPVHAQSIIQSQVVQNNDVVSQRFVKIYIE